MTAVSRLANIALVLGSAPDVVRCKGWPRLAFKTIIAINNAWLVRPDFDYLLHAGDFPEERLPTGESTRSAFVVSSREYVPAQNAFGGFVYAGGTMAFTTAYWVIHRLRPDILAFLGCDMVYEPENGQTHFYGQGTADPLRDDVTLRSLEAKSARLFVQALRAGTLCVNLSRLPASRLIFPRLDFSILHSISKSDAAAMRRGYEEDIDPASAIAGEQMERRLGYFVEDGRYWKQIDRFDPECLRQIDDYWFSSLGRIAKPEPADS